MIKRLINKWLYPHKLCGTGYHLFKHLHRSGNRHGERNIWKCETCGTKIVEFQCSSVYHEIWVDTNDVTVFEKTDNYYN